MKRKIGFFTGARSEYGLSKLLLRELIKDERFDMRIFVNGMHLLKKFGYTISEIKRDGFKISARIMTYSETGIDKEREFTGSIDKIYKAMKKTGLDAVLVAGDRPEAYATALAAHFLKIPVMHLGGGAITEGAVDNIYRYAITFLADLHLATSRDCYERLKGLPVIDRKNIYFTGYTGIDSIYRFLKKPFSITKVTAGIKKNRFVLMTFHPATKKKEPIVHLMDISIKRILKKGYDLLITYPSNDEGYGDIIKVIAKWRGKKGVFVFKNLGAENYYAALNGCSFIVGNSSSGVIEAPYFGKRVLNIGSRQLGREKDTGVMDVPARESLVLRAIDKMLSGRLVPCRCHNIYGDVHAVKKAKSAILKFIGTL